MPIKSGTHNARHYFIFCQKNILVKNAEGGAPALPDESFFNNFVTLQKEAGNLDDVIYDTELSYSAAKVGSENPDGIESQGYSFIVLREFCFLNREDPCLRALALRAKGILFWHDTYRHCPRCGGLFTEDTRETALVCKEGKCNFKLYPRIEPCIIVLIHRGEEILLVKNQPPRDKLYSCIAGFMELGENAIEAVRREVKEEVGLDITNIRPEGSQSWPYPDQLMLAFHADYAGGQIKLQEEEIKEARWFKKENLPVKEELPGRGSVAWNLLVSGGFMKRDKN